MVEVVPGLQFESGVTGGESSYDDVGCRVASP